MRVMMSLVVASFIISCAASFAPTYKEPPCGYRGHSCGNGSCCDEAYDCGGGQFNGCSEGNCCYNGNQLWMAKDGGGAEPNSSRPTNKLQYKEMK